MEKKDLSCNLHGNVNWCYQYEEESVGFLKKKTKKRSTMWSCNPTPGIYLETNMFQKDTSTLNVHINTIYSCQDMEAT